MSLNFHSSSDGSKNGTVRAQRANQSYWVVFFTEHWLSLDVGYYIVSVQNIQAALADLEFLFFQQSRDGKFFCYIDKMCF